MTQFRPRGAVAPLRRPAARATTVDAAVAALRPEAPLHCLRPQAVAAAAHAFVAAFPGDVLYAVKCNAEPAMLRAVAAGGVTHFDCASDAEVRVVRSMFPDAAIHFMHPVKSRAAIRAAWSQFGVRDFVLDTDSELTKILEETGSQDRGLVVRLALPKGSAAYDLSGKFGAAPEEAAALLRAARPHAARLGLSFHVGSQCLDPGAWTRALALAAEVIAAAGVAVEIVDVGGGFPVAYPGSEPPPLAAFMDAIRAGAALLPEGVRLWAEPGRALVAGGASVVVQVQCRRGDALYVNDGVYGALSDAGAPGFRFPHRLLRLDGAASEVPRAFTLFGPTCDSADVMRGPWMLPADVREGDWIEVGQLGAYGTALRTAFNGFDQALVTEVTDSPMLATPGYDTAAARAA
ncbi:type III PLP-dependent enzyme domain-containing protein [Neoroseomonas oryzicola]|uniref:ornithine decarboxylase n=1 Tax=Neoroseomonas oryzicola TaxID=535904 RepID=A0A9X9WD94_9PROT|nr:type III PLP-dependent enzyme [Neoroseomonas oryzicola]MBR0658304.1 type III PLP-dependent enzyme [Neoroseomonas oryzicola]NKE18469.1 type III PLP-dependent enzyme [Neoroseomonas oryzicola]